MIRFFLLLVLLRVLLFFLYSPYASTEIRPLRFGLALVIVSDNWLLCLLSVVTVSWFWKSNVGYDTWKYKRVGCLRTLAYRNLRTWFANVGGTFNLYGGEGPSKSHIIGLLKDPALFQCILIQEGCNEKTLGRADLLVDLYRKITKKYLGTPWQVLDNIEDLDVEIDHVESMDEIPTQVAEESLQACIQVLFDELHLLFPVAVPRTHLYRHLVSDVS
jgi:hypothetical protein